MTSEITRRADEIRGVAASPSCKTVNDLAKAFGWTMETARHANKELSLKLPPSRLRGGELRAAQSCPKPAKKGAGK